MLSVDTPKKERGPAIKARGTLPSREAAKSLRLRRPLFVELVGLLKLPAVSRAGHHGGTATKLFHRHHLQLLKQFLTRCRREGGSSVLSRLMEGHQ